MKTKKTCPFMGGENQLWRNQLMAYAVQESGKFKNAHFSFVQNPANNDLLKTINSYADMLKDKSRFSVFTSDQIVESASETDSKEIHEWVKWYSELYKVAG